MFVFFKKQDPGFWPLPEGGLGPPRLEEAAREALLREGPWALHLQARIGAASILGPP